MSAAGLLQLVLLLALLGLTVRPLGRHMAKVYGELPDGSAPGDRFFAPLERAIYRVGRIDPKREQRWNVYATSLLAFSLVSFCAVYLIARLQGSLPFNPTNVNGVASTGAFNTPP